MSYGFDMGFAQANSLQEAMAIALEYTQSQMTEKNIRKTIRDNLYYIPSVRTGYIADEESKNRRADTLADTADRYWLEALFTFRFLYWEEHKLLGIIMMPPENASEKWPLSIGVPGVVVAGNSLFPDAEREPTDFWFTHKYFALDEKAFENAYQQTKE